MLPALAFAVFAALSTPSVDLPINLRPTLVERRGRVVEVWRSANDIAFKIRIATAVKNARGEIAVIEDPNGKPLFSLLPGDTYTMPLVSPGNNWRSVNLLTSIAVYVDQDDKQHAVALCVQNRGRGFEPSNAPVFSDMLTLLRRILSAPPVRCRSAPDTR